MPRHLCLDLGSRRVGVAVSDPAGVVAVPVQTLERDARRSLASQLAAVVDEYEPAVLVVGLPVRTDGTEGREASAIRVEAAELAGALGIPLQFADERFSTAIAHGAAAAMGANSRRRRGSIDEMAATVILQGYLDRTSPSDCAPGS